MKFETLGNATLQFFRDGHPVLATDPWLKGTCYFGSWALEKPLTDTQIANVLASDYLWISHGHPDHMHIESLAMLPQGKRVLVPDHYHAEIRDFLVGQGFDVTVMPYRAWIDLGRGMRAMCLDNPNQDAILVVEAGDALVINQNDSPLAADLPFLRRLVRTHPNDKTYLAALCSIDADMLNFVDGNDRRITAPPAQLKAGKVHEVSIRAAALGVRNFCCSSNQHIYVRADSAWVNDYRIAWPEMQAHWSRRQVRLIEPFVTVDLETGEVTRNHPSQTSDFSQVTHGTGEDDWRATLTETEWHSVEAFMKRFHLLRRHMDFVSFTIGGETRTITLGRGDRGVRFAVPKQSLLAAVEYGYFDDLLIGNFMKTELKGMRLYPWFSPLVAKVGGNAKVFTPEEYRAFHWRYFKRAPLAYLRYQSERTWRQSISPALITFLARLGVKEQARKAFRMLKRVPT
jgi:hypothetical protein